MDSFSWSLWLKYLIRSGVCGAWTFESYPNSEDGSGSCRLKSINACCGQFAKREVTATASVVSGYMCSKCWSTRNQCPCSFEDRRSSIDSNFIIAGGALKDLSPTVRAQIFGGFAISAFTFTVFQSIFAATRRPCSYKRVVFRWSKRWRRWRRVNVQKDDNPESVSCWSHWLCSPDFKSKSKLKNQDSRTHFEVWKTDWMIECKLCLAWRSKLSTLLLVSFWSQTVLFHDQGWFSVLSGSRKAELTLSFTFI